MRGDHMAVVETERHGQILVVRMNRPERLNALSQEMRTQLAETQSSITAARDRYMAAVRNFNTMVQTFPTDVTARVFDFRARPNLTAAAEK